MRIKLLYGIAERNDYGVYIYTNTTELTIINIYHAMEL